MRKREGRLSSWQIYCCQHMWEVEHVEIKARMESPCCTMQQDILREERCELSSSTGCSRQFATGLWMLLSTWCRACCVPDIDWVLKFLTNNLKGTNRITCIGKVHLQYFMITFPSFSTMFFIFFHDVQNYPSSAGASTLGPSKFGDKSFICWMWAPFLTLLLKAKSERIYEMDMYTTLLYVAHDYPTHPSMLVGRSYAYRPHPPRPQAPAPAVGLKSDIPLNLALVWPSPSGLEPCDLPLLPSLTYESAASWESRVEKNKQIPVQRAAKNFRKEVTTFVVSTTSPDREM